MCTCQLRKWDSARRRVEHGQTTLQSSGRPTENKTWAGHRTLQGGTRAMKQDALMTAARAIASGNRANSFDREAAAARFEVGATRASAKAWYLESIGHYIYRGDTLLHVAAAYDIDAARALLSAGADVRARNRRGAEPLHYAADGSPNSPWWNPSRQTTVVLMLIEAGADPDALDNSGVAPLHRAVRTRCADAVRALLQGGADPHLENRSGSTPLSLAFQTTGRGGSGSPEAKREQERIVEILSGSRESGDD